MSNFTLVINSNKQPLDPIHPGAARRLLNAGKAAVYRVYPFTIILKSEVNQTSTPIVLKLDPGSKTTGIALLQNDKVIWAAELTHRGATIKAALLSRRQLRRGRRNRKTRYRQARFLNRTRPKAKSAAGRVTRPMVLGFPLSCRTQTGGNLPFDAPQVEHLFKTGWLAPSLQHRVDTTITWVNKLIKFAPIGSIVQELVRFDLQQLENPEISGVEYQQGELLGYEVREYLLNKWDRQCTYCQVKDVPLQVEHVVPKARGGSNRISNLCLACDKCNKKKGTLNIKELLSEKPDLLRKIQSQLKAPLKDAAAVNSTRWALFDRLKLTGLPVSTGSGGLTKFNRTKLSLPKTHWLDAACVGVVETLDVLISQPLLIKCQGHGTRQMCRTDKFGFPNRHVPRHKFVRGFQTGDIVKSIVTAGTKIGEYVGRIAVRSSGSFNISTRLGLIQGISHKYCQIIHRKDGYSYQFQS
jgi:5-methylcytosine-specific restriction endonuclease McrA